MRTASAAARQWAVVSLSNCRYRPSHLFGRRGYQDEAFAWARQNPDAARACLNVPSQTSSLFFEHTTTTMEDYWEQRQWDWLGCNDANERTFAQRLVSHVLSAPLTFARHFISQPTQNVCIVGARAEATLPCEYWREALVASSCPSLKWTLDFVGPDVAVGRTPELLQYQDSTLTLQWSHSGYLHEFQSPPAWHGFCLFNPGLAHPHLNKEWMPTLKYLLETKRPILLTAHSLQDANRDATLLQSLLGQPVEYQPNAFSSRITYKDPFSQEENLVSPNSYVTLLQQ